MVIMELAASERLFRASVSIATDLERKPTKALKAARKIFAAIPIILVNIMVLFLF